MNKMTIDDKVSKMQEEVIEMGRYYYKGMGGKIDGILSCAEAVLNGLEEIDNKRITYRELIEIKNFYNRINFDELKNREKFYPLFIVKRLLPHFEAYLDEFFKEKSKSSFDHLFGMGVSIVNVGRLYDDNIKSLLKEIRKNPEAKDFRLKILDYNSKEWNF